MQKKYLLLNFISLIAALMTAALSGEFYLATLLLMLPAYYFFYAIYLTTSYWRLPSHGTFNKKLLYIPLCSFITYLLVFAAAFILYQRINATVATEITHISPCAAQEQCEAAVVVTYRQILEKRFFLTRDNHCVHLRSPGYALVKTDISHCPPKS